MTEGTEPGPPRTLLAAPPPRVLKPSRSPLSAPPPLPCLSSAPPPSSCSRSLSCSCLSAPRMRRACVWAWTLTSGPRGYLTSLVRVQGSGPRVQGPGFSLYGEGGRDAAKEEACCCCCCLPAYYCPLLLLAGHGGVVGQLVMLQHAAEWPSVNLVLPTPDGGDMQQVRMGGGREQDCSCAPSPTTAPSLVQHSAKSEPPTPPSPSPAPFQVPIKPSLPPPTCGRGRIPGPDASVAPRPAHPACRSPISPWACSTCGPSSYAPSPPTAPLDPCPWSSTRACYSHGPCPWTRRRWTVVAGWLPPATAAAGPHGRAWWGVRPGCTSRWRGGEGCDGPVLGGCGVGRWGPWLSLMGEREGRVHFQRVRCGGGGLVRLSPPTVLPQTLTDPLTAP